MFVGFLKIFSYGIVVWCSILYPIKNTLGCWRRSWQRSASSREVQFSAWRSAFCILRYMLQKLSLQKCITECILRYFLLSLCIKRMSGRGQSCASCWGPQSQEMASFPKLYFPKGDELEMCPFASWVTHKPVSTGAFSSILLQEGGNHSYNFRKKVSENDYKKWKHFF